MLYFQKMPVNHSRVKMIFFILLIVSHGYSYKNDEIICGSTAVPFGTEVCVYEKNETSASIKYSESDEDHNCDDSQIVYQCIDANNSFNG